MCVATYASKRHCPALSRLQSKWTTVYGSRPQLVASATHEDLYVAINEVEHKLARQLNKLAHKSEESRRVTRHELVEEEE